MNGARRAGATTGETTGVNDDDMDLASGISAFESRQFAQAMRLLTPLAEAGDCEALYRVAVMHANGLGVVRNAERAEQAMRRAAEAGHALACHGLGFMYMNGEGVPRSGEQAVYWLGLAAGQGLVGATTTLAMLYREGELVPRDEARAERLLREAGF